ncbi:MAG: ASKHA domain-containing protein [Clostridiaceae bacterium]|nr:ASKHA domain-containing protein [Clostridiaceae bacterium]
MVIFRETEKTAAKIAVPEYRFSRFHKKSGEKNKSGEKMFGIAVDIGTTTVEMALFGWDQQKPLAEKSETNAQTVLGADVMMRIMHAVSGKADRLHQLIVGQIEQMAQDCLKKTQLFEHYRQNEIGLVFCVAGNTTMSHLFLGKSVEGLGGYPFSTAYQGSVRTVGKEIGMSAFPDAEVNVLSGIAGHVGGDALGVIGSVGLYGGDKLQLAVDLGTNAEIILNQHGRLSVCSAAAGPAFEGKGIACGCRAKPGAVNGVKIALGSGNLILEFLPGQHVTGICSSGLVDLIAQLLKCRLLREDGYLLTREEAMRQGVLAALANRLEQRGDERIFLLCSLQENPKEIYLTQKDIRNVQLAKGAIQAAVSSILEYRGVSLHELDEVVVAGALGNGLRLANAVAIGLLPDVEKSRLRFVGNAAIYGAAQMFFEPDFSDSMQKLASQIQHLELAGYSGFQNKLMQAMSFRKY